MTNTETHTIIVIPCTAPKLDTAAAARDLYVGANFGHMLAAAEAEAAATTRDLGTPARVMILSALHGLVELDTVIAPYDVRMGDAGAIAPDALADQIDALNPVDVVSLLPGAYNEVLVAAAQWSDAEPAVYETFEVAPGIGYQRGVASSLIRTAA